MDYKKRKLLEFDESETIVNDIEKVEKEDFGYELDESGMIPKLEELKAVKSDETMNALNLDESILDEEDDVLENDMLYDDTDEFDNMYNLNALDDIDDDFSNLKIDFYDDESTAVKELNRIANALERIADQLEKRN